MNQKGKHLYEIAVNTTMQFGMPGRPNAVVINNAAIDKRNFKGVDIPITPKNGGRSFIKKGRRFTLCLTENLFSALCNEKGKCAYTEWAFGGEEDPDVKLYCIEVIVNMASSYPPEAKLYISDENGKWENEHPESLTDTSIGVLDEVELLDIDRVDLILNPYDRDKTGNFTFYLNSIKMAQKYVDSADDAYWTNSVPRRGDDPNID